MNDVTLVCTACSSATPAGSFGACPVCGGILGLPPAPGPQPDARPADGVLGRIGDLGLGGLRPVSLGEGGTPLVALPALAGAVHHAKLEACNPTGSWKDRLQSVNAAVARQLGFRGMALVSTGNSALAAAAYAARAGLALQAHLWPSAPQTIVRAVQELGADVRVVERAPDLRRALDEEGLFPATMSLPHDVANPFGLEGYKTIAYEIADALGGVPDWVAVPVGCGDGLHAIAKGFAELAAWGAIARVPRMLAAQAEAAAPLALAFAQGRETIERVVPAPSSAISIADPIAGEHALAAVRRTDGAALAVSEAEIERARAALLAEGIVAEPASAASVAAVARAREQAIVGEDDVVVSVVTSSGLRWLY